jgi:hypothetical protein
MFMEVHRNVTGKREVNERNWRSQRGQEQQNRRDRSVHGGQEPAWGGGGAHGLLESGPGCVGRAGRDRNFNRVDWIVQYMGEETSTEWAGM